MFCSTLLYVHSSTAIILMGKRELVALLVSRDCCVASQVSTPITHNLRVCTFLTFSSVVVSLGRPDRPSSSTLSLPLLNYATHFFTVL